MFDSIGWGEIAVLALAALFIFGPERLPTLAKDAATGLRKVREAVTGMRDQVQESLGDDLPDLHDLDLRRYHPKTFLREQLFADEPIVHRAGPTGATAVGVRPRDAATPPPFDVDAT